MNDSSGSPNPDLVYSLYTGVFRPQLVRIALGLDIFTPLAGGPADAQTVAQACGCSPQGTQILLDYFCSVGMVERHADNYTLTPTASIFLVPGKKSYVGELVLEETSHETEQAYLSALRSGQPCHHLIPFVPWAQDAWLESYSPWRPAKSLEMWKLAGFEAGRTSRLRIIDLACGCAIKSLSLAQADRLVQVSCVDRAEVLDVARDLAERLGVLPQVVFLPGDIHSIDLGEGQYEAALLGQITYYLTPEQNTALFKRVYQSLRSDGVLVIDARMVAEEAEEYDYLVSFFTWAFSGGKAHTFAEYSSWLKAAGFKTMKQLGKNWLSAQ